jgi:hypothetical protein
VSGLRVDLLYCWAFCVISSALGKGKDPTCRCEVMSFQECREIGKASQVRELIVLSSFSEKDAKYAMAIESGRSVARDIGWDRGVKDISRNENQPFKGIKSRK